MQLVYARRKAINLSLSYKCTCRGHLPSLFSSSERAAVGIHTHNTSRSICSAETKPRNFVVH